MTEYKPNIIAINGGKKNFKREREKEDELPTINIDDTTFALNSFVLSGVDENGKHCLMTFNCSLEQLTTYSMFIDTMVRDKIRENLL